MVAGVVFTVNITSPCVEPLSKMSCECCLVAAKSVVFLSISALTYSAKYEAGAFYLQEPVLLFLREKTY